MKNWIVMLLLVVVGVGAACSDDDGKADNPCGEGDAVARDGTTYCVYDQALIIEGFRCPAARPHRFDGPGGDVVCSPDEDLPSETVDDIFERWSPDENIGSPDAGNNTNNIDPGTCTIDADCPEGERCGVNNVCERPIEPPTCDGITQFNGDSLSVGDEALVIDWTCPVTQCCGDGVFIASCPEMGGDYICASSINGYDCSAWDETQMLGCPAIDGGQGETCAWSLDERSCGDGLYCDIAENPGEPIFDGSRNRGTCEPKPAICNGDACFDDADCGGDPRGRCYGADERNGVLGVCRDQPVVPPACLDESDCPFDWDCVGATFGCDDACGCADPAAADTRGTCEKVNGGSTPQLWLRNSNDLTWLSRLEIYWAKADIGTDSNWVDCPAYTVEVLDSETGWVALGSEACRQVSPGEVRELVPGEIMTLDPYPLNPHQQATEGLIRLRGSYYTGCTGTTTASCTGGPFERFSPAQYVVRP